MPLVQTRGAASAQGFGEFAQPAAAVNYVEDVFSTYLYTGNGSTQTVTNGIDLSTKGGLVWIKGRSAGAAYNHRLQDTIRGTGVYLSSNTTSAETSQATGVTAFNATGFNLGSNAISNQNNETYCSWTFREQAKFFDIVTYTGNGVTTGRTISHNLGSVPGMMILKVIDLAGDDWYVYHRSIPTSLLALNLTNGTGSPPTTPSTIFGNGSTTVAPTSTQVTIGGTANSNGYSYILYLFAHDAGGFGTAGTDNVISCGSFTGDSTVTLGYEPQYLMFKRTDSTGNWRVLDNMRGMPVIASSTGSQQVLFPNTSGAESTDGVASPTATGFQTFLGGGTYIYMAIRRGPMKVPTTGTSVYYPQALPQADTRDSTNVPFPPDLVTNFSRNGTNRGVIYTQFQFADRLRSLGTPANNLLVSGCPTLVSSSTGAENTAGSYIQLKADGINTTASNGWNNALYGNYIYYFMRRAPGFFDVVCYTGTGSSGYTVAHNLTVIPEIIIIKKRSASGANWNTYVTNQSTSYIPLLLNDAGGSGGYLVSQSNSASSSLLKVGYIANNWDGQSNDSGATYVAYLFATCAGVSKVGSYSGTGATQTINCGFTGGARFVLIKRINDSGGWYVWDTARGMVSGTDPFLALNTTSAESNINTVYTIATGFQIVGTDPELNASGSTYLFLAIA
jgi:hypothetical protein